MILSSSITHTRQTKSLSDSSLRRLNSLQFRTHLGLFVERIKRITPGRQSVTWRSSAITKCSTNLFVVYFFALDHVARYFRIRQYHSAQANEDNPFFANGSLGDEWKILLQV